MTAVLVDDNENQDWIRTLTAQREHSTPNTRVVRVVDAVGNEHDDLGMFTSKSAGSVGSEHVISKSVKLAMERADAAPHPTKEAVDEMRHKYATLGSRKVESNLRGNSAARRASRERLLEQFGNGKTAPCVYCGRVLDNDTMERDRIIPGWDGGRYTNDNLVPACVACNHGRGETPFYAFMAKMGHDTSERKDWTPEAAYGYSGA
jgi:5-methylcytosine-specific restriction endonuclease McrA